MIFCLITRWLIVICIVITANVVASKEYTNEFALHIDVQDPQEADLFADELALLHGFTNKGKVSVILYVICCPWILI